MSLRLATWTVDITSQSTSFHRPRKVASDESSSADVRWGRKRVKTQRRKAWACVKSWSAMSSWTTFDSAHSFSFLSQLDPSGSSNSSISRSKLTSFRYQDVSARPVGSREIILLSKKTRGSVKLFFNKFQIFNNSWCASSLNNAGSTRSTGK